MSLSYEVLKYLESLNFGTEEVNLFNGFQPDDPDDCITIYDCQASPLDESDCLSVDNFGIQVLVRNTAYETASNKSIAIHRSLVGFSGELFEGGSNISYFQCKDDSPYSIGKDNKGRNEWSAYYQVRVMSIGDLHRL
jgi:hypothetical protein